MTEERVQRRLAAILAADVAGYSRLMGADEEGTLARLKALRHELLDPKINEHRGRIVKTTGDGLLAEFASVVDALRCAVDVQRGMAERNAGMPSEQRIEFRLGLNVGDIVIEDGDIYGDGVNVAARLEALAEPGGLCVSARVLEDARGKLDLSFDDLGEQRLKNIAWPVRVHRVRLGNEAVRVQYPSQPADKPSIVVLPFANMSGDPEQEYFSDGITEDIITDLSRFRNLLVIARNSSFAYKGKSVNIRTIARELGVEYVLEGSVRRAGPRVRITAQLIEAASSRHIWAERYDRELVDIFEVQDEVTSSIVGALAVELEGESLSRAERKPPETLQAYDHWLRGKRLIFLMGQKSLEARRHFEAAAAADPSFSRAYSGMALTYQMEALDFPLPEDFRTADEKAFQSAQKALGLDHANHQAHLALAYCYLYRRDCVQAKKHVERAVQFNPSDGDTLANAAYFFALVGEAEKGVQFGKAALRLNPHHPDWYLGFLSTSLFTLRDYAEALSARLRAPEVFIDSPFFTAAILAQMDRLGEAKIWAARALARLSSTPGGALAIAEGRVVGLLLDNNPFCRPEDREHFAEGMRKAGVPG
jgi:adenylate cyclase